MGNILKTELRSPICAWRNQIMCLRFNATINAHFVRRQISKCEFAVQIAARSDIADLYSVNLYQESDFLVFVNQSFLFLLRKLRSAPCYTQGRFVGLECYTHHITIATAYKSPSRQQCTVGTQQPFLHNHSPDSILPGLVAQFPIHYNKQFQTKGSSCSFTRMCVQSLG